MAREAKQANEDLREEQTHEEGKPVRRIAKDLHMNGGLGQVLEPNPGKTRGEKKLEKAAENDPEKNSR